MKEYELRPEEDGGYEVYDNLGNFLFYASSQRDAQEKLVNLIRPTILLSIDKEGNIVQKSKKSYK